LLDPAVLRERCRQSHLGPTVSLAPFVSAAWILHWDLAAHEAIIQRVLPDPCVQIVVDRDGAHVFGVVTSLFSVTLTGSRFVLGLKFRPGAFRAFTRQSISALTNRTMRLGEIFPEVDERQLGLMADAADGRALMDTLEAHLTRRAPTMDPRLRQVYEIVDRIAGDPTILSVEHAAQILRVSRRSLQRLCRTYVGANPKWLIRLYRIKEAAARIEQGKVDNWADLAARLGYADQAHFVNDFRRLVGQSPGRYAAAMRRRLISAPDSHS
jgi:AraC-like DNA-binding protein